MFEDDPLLAAFAQELRAAADAVPAPAARADLAAVLEGLAPAAAPAWVPPPPRRRRSLTLRWTIAGAAFGLGVGSLGVAGALPAPVQRQLSHFGDVVGVNLPEPAQDTPATSVVPTSIPPHTLPTQATTTRGRGSHDVEVDDNDEPTTGTTVDRDQGDEHSAPQAGDDVGRSGDHPTPDAEEHARAHDEKSESDGDGHAHVEVTVPDSSHGGSDSRSDGSNGQRVLRPGD